MIDESELETRQDEELVPQFVCNSLLPELVRLFFVSFLRGASRMYLEFENFSCFSGIACPQ